MLRSGLILMIKQKALAGQSPYSIGKELGISKNTAKKYAAGDTEQYRLKGWILGGWLVLPRRDFHPLYSVRFLAHGTFIPSFIAFGAKTRSKKGAC